MLRITPQISSARAKDYYSTADYFTEGHEIRGIWGGKGAAHLSLHGTIEKAAWDALCDNINPKTGEQLTARKNDYRRVGWDFTFDVPKSVSLLFALTKDPRIIDAFSQSVDETMLDIESELHVRVRSKGQDTDRLTSNGIWGRYVHTTTRPTDGVPDPHLHAHCFLFNASYDAYENQWKAAQIAEIKQDGNYFGALMHSRLAVRLVELGIPLERTAKSWRVAGLDQITESKFSRRTKEIEKLAKQLGITDPAEKAKLGALTRDGKIKHLSFDELRATWLSWLTPDESDVMQRIERGMQNPATPVFNAATAKEAIAFAAEHHFERESVIPERMLLTTALHHAIGQATPESVFAAQRGTDFITGEDKGRRMVTSPAVLEEERRMIRFARDGRNTCCALAPIQENDVPAWFNKDQKQALVHLCNSSDRVVLLRGSAGTGKSTLLSTLKQKIESNGKQIFAFAPSTDASRGVLREIGFDNAETVAHLLASPQAQTAIQNQVILIDESGLLGSPTMAKIFDLADRANARIIICGDRYQHHSVERGAALRLLEEEAGIRSARLTEILRQKDRYKQAVAYLSQGRVEAGFKALEDLNWVHEIADPQTRYDRIAAEYLQATEAGKSVILVSPTHAESGKVTRTLRGLLQREGNIGEDKASVLKLTNRNLTLAQRGDAVNYADNDIIVFTQNAPGYTKGTRLTVGIDPVPLHLAHRFSVYHAGELALAQGDVIRITANAATADGHRVSNGHTYTIRSIARDGTLTLNNGWHLGSRFGQIDYGYCGTSHASQGKTKDVVIVAASTESFPAVSREQAYVSISRGRSRCSIYSDDKEGLLEAASGTSDRISATELVGRNPTLSPHRRRVLQQSIEPYIIPQPTLQRDGGRYDY
ncbi:MAG: relaxase domain-containing protein [Burkholderiales bacterium]|nr:relaxase domain-containing protein [Phycisphaerae bacterium]